MSHHPTPPFQGAPEGSLSPDELAKMAQAAQAHFGGGMPQVPGGAPQAPPRPDAKTEPPTTKVTNFSYRTPDGVEHQQSLTLRLLSFDERCLVAQRVALALGGQAWDSVPLEDAIHIRAAVWCDVCWPQAPEWLRQAWYGDVLLAGALYDKGAALKDAYFRGVVPQGGAAPQAPRLVFHSTEPAPGTGGPTP